MRYFHRAAATSVAVVVIAILVVAYVVRAFNAPAGVNHGDGHIVEEHRSEDFHPAAAVTGGAVCVDPGIAHDIGARHP